MLVSSSFGVGHTFAQGQVSQIIVGNRERCSIFIGEFHVYISAFKTSKFRMSSVISKPQIISNRMMLNHPVAIESKRQHAKRQWLKPLQVRSQYGERHRLHHGQSLDRTVERPRRDTEFFRSRTTASFLEDIQCNAESSFIIARCTHGTASRAAFRCRTRRSLSLDGVTTHVLNHAKNRHFER